MTIHTSYTQARTNLASLCDQVAQTRVIVFIERRGAEPIALIAAGELTGLLETVYLLKSPKNAGRLMRALTRARQEEGLPQTVEELAQEVGLTKTAERP